jgi:serine/threonine protein phosphatase PrpC
MAQETHHLPSESRIENESNKERVEEGSVSTLSVVSYSHIGSSHIELGKPNQDYSHFGKDDDTLFVAVADGLGSCAFSDEGSELVSRQITEKMRDAVKSALSETTNKSKDRILLRLGPLKIAKEYQAREDVRHPLARLDELAFTTAFVKSVEAIRAELDVLSTTTKARGRQPDIDQHPNALAGNDRHRVSITFSKEDFASTCLFAMTDGKKGFCSHIGDGGIYLVCKNQSELLLEPTKGDSLNETIPLTHKEWRNYLKIKVVDIPKDALFLCLMTDGFAENISKSDPNSFFQRIVNEATKKTRSEFVAWLRELNDYYESRAFSDDDKTATFIFFKDIFRDRAE